MGKIGICSLCLEMRRLSFEHTPPRRVFNNRPEVAHTVFGLGLGSAHQKPPVLLSCPRGLGRPTLCEGCNGKTADLYGDAFADWTAQCLTYAQRLRQTSTVLLPFHIMPLNVLKQIATMLMAVSGCNKSTPILDAIRHFVLSPRSMLLPPKVRFAVYFNPMDPARKKNPLLTQNRMSESCAVLDTRAGTSVFVLGEVAFPPMGYVAYFAEEYEQVSHDFVSLCDIRQLSHHPLDRDATLFCQMPVRYPFGPVPGYYPNLHDPQQRQFLDDNHVLLASTNGAVPRC